MSTTTSIRLDKELLEEIDSKCNPLGCTRNDFIKSAIKSKLNKEDDDVAHEPYTDDIGNRWYWNYNSNNWVCQINPKNLRVVP